MSTMYFVYQSLNLAEVHNSSTSKSRNVFFDNPARTSNLELLEITFCAKTRCECLQITRVSKTCLLRFLLTLIHETRSCRAGWGWSWDLCLCHSIYSHRALRPRSCLISVDDFLFTKKLRSTIVCSSFLRQLHFELFSCLSSFVRQRSLLLMLFH